MRGPSRAALSAARERLEALLRGPSAPSTDSIASSLFAVTDLLSGNPGLRRALADPTRPASAKSGLVHQLLGSRIAPAAVEVLDSLVAGSWSDPSDLTAATEQLGVLAVLIGAEQAGTFDSVEDELFRFSRTIAGDTGLRDAFAARTTGRDRKEQLVRSLLAGRTAPQTLTLAIQAASATRGRRTEQILTEYLDLAAAHRSQVTAQVVVAVPLSERQRTRLSGILEQMFNRPIRLAVEVQPEVIGGIRVEVAGELLDSTVLGRLHAVQRQLAG